MGLPFFTTASTVSGEPRSVITLIGTLAPSVSGFFTSRRSRYVPVALHLETLVRGHGHKVEWLGFAGRAKFKDAGSVGRWLLENDVVCGRIHDDEVSLGRSRSSRRPLHPAAGNRRFFPLNGCRGGREEKHEHAPHQAAHRRSWRKMHVNAVHYHSVSRAL